MLIPLLQDLHAFCFPKTPLSGQSQVLQATCCIHLRYTPFVQMVMPSGHWSEWSFSSDMKQKGNCKGCMSIPGHYRQPTRHTQPHAY